MDVDAFVATHSAEWLRLEQLLARASRLSGDEVDELVTLYQRVGTHLAVVRSSTPDPALVARLSTLVAKARAVVSGSPVPAWKDFGRFFAVVYPAAVYRSARWWVPVGVAFILVSLAVAAWVARNPDVQATILAPEEIRQLVEHDFEEYYSSAPAGSFATRVATNNAFVTALVLGSGVLILPAVWILFNNAQSVGVVGGLMAANGKTDLFFGLITPHGLLELTCVFVAGGAGLRLGWCWVSPGPHLRSQLLMREGLAMGALVLGLAATLLVSAIIEAFVTPSGLPTWARIAIGLSAWTAFLAYVFVLGRRAALAGEVGDVRGAGGTDVSPSAG